MSELVDDTDLKSVGGKTPCGFDSHPAHHNQTFRNFADWFSRASRGRERKHWLAAHSAARQAEIQVAGVANNRIIKIEAGKNQNPTLDTLKK